VTSFKKFNLLKFIFVSIYFVLLYLGIDLSIPIQVIPDETSQLLNIYGQIQNFSLKLPYESYYTVWAHVILLPFTVLYWGFDYVIQGFPDISQFKKYVAENYMLVLPYLRLVSALIFIHSLWQLSKVIQNYFGIKAATLFFVLVLLDLLVFINLHYSKHWIVDISLIFYSIYSYERYINSGRIFFFYIGVIVFMIGVFSTHPLAVAFIYPMLIFFHLGKTKNQFFREFLIALIIFIIFTLITLYLGPGKIIGDLFSNGSTNQLHFSLDLIPVFIRSIFDYNPILTTLFLLTLVYGLYKKRYIYLIFSTPFFAYLILISQFHFEPRYSLFLVISMALPVAVFLSKFYSKLFLVFFIGVNFSLIATWNLIITNVDTRQMTVDWIKENYNNNNFLIFNTVGFNYVSMRSEGVKFLQQNFPEMIGTREKLITELGLTGSFNNTILRKFDESNYSGTELISSLLKNDYKPILINERFGYDAYFFQPAPNTFNEIIKNCEYKIIQEFLPYRGDKIPHDFEEYGDILYNFNGVIQTFLKIERPGPVIKIFEFAEKQPSTCTN